MNGNRKEDIQKVGFFWKVDFKDGGIAKSPYFFLSELGDAKLKQEEVDDHLEAEAHGGVCHKPGTTFVSIF